MSDPIWECGIYRCINFCNYLDVELLYPSRQSDALSVVWWLVPRYIVGESEMEASKEGRRLTDFRYGCIGYSVYPDLKDRTDNVQETQTELPVCVGLEVSFFYFVL